MFSDVVRYVKAASPARISIIFGQIVNGEGLDGKGAGTSEESKRRSWAGMKRLLEEARGSKGQVSESSSANEAKLAPLIHLGIALRMKR